MNDASASPHSDARPWRRQLRREGVALVIALQLAIVYFLFPFLEFAWHVGIVAAQGTLIGLWCGFGESHWVKRLSSTVLMLFWLYIVLSMELSWHWPRYGFAWHLGSVALAVQTAVGIAAITICRWVFDSTVGFPKWTFPAADQATALSLRDIFILILRIAAALGVFRLIWPFEFGLYYSLDDVWAEIMPAVVVAICASTVCGTLALFLIFGNRGYRAAALAFLPLLLLVYAFVGENYLWISTGHDYDWVRAEVGFVATLVTTMIALRLLGFRLEAAVKRKPSGSDPRTAAKGQ